MKEINQFSASTLAALQKDEKHLYYVYCLVDPRNNQPFYTVSYTHLTLPTKA